LLHTLIVLIFSALNVASGLGTPMKNIAVVALVLALSSCQGSVVGDAMAGKEGLAKQDDQYCQSIGAKPGTDVYVQCRMMAGQNRDNRHANAWANYNRSVANMNANRPRNTSCNAFGNTLNCTTY
jgi:hypothetical protein